MFSFEYSMSGLKTFIKESELDPNLAAALSPIKTSVGGATIFTAFSGIGPWL